MAMPVSEAAAQILDAIPPLQPIDLPLAEAYGCVVATDVPTEYDIPPFSAAEVDGFAARAADIVAAAPASPASLRLVGRSWRGRPPEVTVGWGEAVRIMAGAPMPAGADCVVPSDRATAQDETVAVSVPVAAGSNVSAAGEDVKAGSTLVPAGRRLSAAELGLLATAGYGSVPAFPRLRIGVLAVGDLVEPGRPSGFGQVRDAVSYLLLGAFVSFELFVRRGLLRMMGRGALKRPEVTAVLDEPVHGPSGVALFVPARMAHRDGAWHVRPTGPAEEGHLGSLAEANALLTVPPGGASGGEVRVRVLRPLER